MNLRQLFSPWLVAIVAELCLVGAMSRHGDFLRAGEAGRFAAFGIAAGIVYWLAVVRFLKTPLSASQKTRWFWAVAVGLRLAILPVLTGDDLWRYRWEGRIQLHGFNPYQLAPDAPALVPLRDAEWNRISHLNFPAIYPPLAEMTFAALAAMRTPVAGYKLLFGLVDLGVVFLLRRLLARGPGPPDLAAWYAWNPLVVYAAAGAAHFDGLMVLTLLGAILLLERATAENRASAAWSSAALLGVSAALKIVPLALVPVWFFALGWRRAWWTLPVAVLVPVGLATWYGFPGVPVFGALGRFGRDFRVNDALWWTVDARVPLDGKWVQAAGAGVCGALAVRWRRDWRRGVWWVMGAALLLSPVVNAWYVVWVLPLAVWRGGTARAWFVWSVSVFGYFLLWEVNHDSGRPWTEPLWLRGLVYLPPLAAWAGINARGHTSGSEAAQNMVGTRSPDERDAPIH